MEEKIIMLDSDESAHYVTNLSGWVNRHGLFYGDDEHLARWSGATHTPCEKCGQPTPKSWILCNVCRAEKDKARFDALPKKKWEGEPLYSYAADEYFFTEDELEEHLEDNETTWDEMRLVICEPEYATEIDPNEHYADSLDEEGGVDEVLEEAFEALNKVIREHKVPLIWRPGEVAAIRDLAGLKSEEKIDCPALHSQSEHYPQRWNGKVPKRIRMLTTVRSDIPIPSCYGLVAIRDNEYPCWTNSHGAVSAVLEDGRELGVKPDEFEVIEWYEPEVKP